MAVSVQGRPGAKRGESVMLTVTTCEEHCARYQECVRMLNGMDLSLADFLNPDT